MSSGWLLLCAFVVGVAGMAWLALAKVPHWRQVTGEHTQAPATRQRLRMAGAAALAGSLTLCLAADHISMSFLVWVMIIAAGALGVAFTLAWRPRILGWMALKSTGNSTH